MDSLKLSAVVSTFQKSPRSQTCKKLVTTRYLISHLEITTEALSGVIRQSCLLRFRVACCVVTT